ncbi:MAG: hypothetical protein PPP58_00075 [Natronomonas sp.]
MADRVVVRLDTGRGSETRWLDPEAAAIVCRPTSIELLRAVARDEPESIRAAARLVDRDVHQVHDNLRELGRIGLVEFERSGRSRAPIVPYERVSVEIDL